MAIACASINENTQMWEITQIGDIAKDKNSLHLAHLHIKRNKLLLGERQLNLNKFKTLPINLRPCGNTQL
jgi:hypothetical protein